MKIKMSIVHCWNDNGWEKPNYSEKTLFQAASSVHHKLHMERPGLVQWPRGNAPATRSKSKINF
jgi:hypothetical protein